jgi:CBS domain-containing protein
MDIVGDWMTSPAIVALDTMTLPHARDLLQSRQIRRLPVVDAAGKLVGIVSEGDINRISDSHVTDVRDYNLYHRVADLPVRDFMTQPVIVVTPDTPMVRVASLLLKHRIGGMPVVEMGQLVGMVTESNVFGFLIATQQVELEHGASTH